MKRTVFFVLACMSVSFSTYASQCVDLSGVYELVDHQTNCRGRLLSGGAAAGEFGEPNQALLLLPHSYGTEYEGMTQPVYSHSSKLPPHYRTTGVLVIRQTGCEEIAISNTLSESIPAFRINPRANQNKYRVQWINGGHALRVRLAFHKQDINSPWESNWILTRKADGSLGVQAWYERNGFEHLFNTRYGKRAICKLVPSRVLE